EHGGQLDVSVFLGGEQEAPGVAVGRAPLEGRLAVPDDYGPTGEAGRQPLPPSQVRGCHLAAEPGRRGKEAQGDEPTGQGGEGCKPSHRVTSGQVPLYFPAAFSRALSRTSASRTGDPPRRLLSWAA